MTKIFYLYEKCFELNQNFTTEHAKIVKIPVFPGYFCLHFRIPGFSRFSKFPGKVATLLILKATT